MRDPQTLTYCVSPKRKYEKQVRFKHILCQSLLTLQKMHPRKSGLECGLWVFSVRLHVLYTVIQLAHNYQATRTPNCADT